MKQILMNRNIRYAVIVFVLVLTALGIWNYINTYLYKSKAANSQVRIGFLDPAPVGSLQTIDPIKEGEEFYLPVFIGSVDTSEKISSIDLRLTYNSSLQYISFDLKSQTSTFFFDEKVMENIGPGTLRIVLVAKKTTDALVSNVTLNLKFKSPNAGTVTFNIDRTNSVVVGSSLVNPKFDFKEGDESTKSVVIEGTTSGPGSGTIPIPTNTSVPTTAATPIPTSPPVGSCTDTQTSSDCPDDQACVGGTCGTPSCPIPEGKDSVCYDKTYTGHICSTIIRRNDGYSCGDNKSCFEGVCVEQGTSGTPSPTVSSSGVTLNLSLRFQGITGAVASGRTTMPVRFTISGGGLSQTVVKSADFFTSGGGIWTGSINFPDLSASTYTIFVKGPRHVQKKICDATPSDQGVTGSYRCRADSAGVTVSSGGNTLDFSNISLLSGDLPLPDGGQDGIIDSKDVSYIRNNLGNKEDTVCDINMDGICDSQDYTLLYKSLEVKYDEE